MKSLRSRPLSGVPVINAQLIFTPCQIYADCMTILEKLGDDENPFSGLRGKLSFLEILPAIWQFMDSHWTLLEMEITLCGPSEFQPHRKSQMLSKNGLTQHGLFVMTLLRVLKMQMWYTQMYGSAWDVKMSRNKRKI